MSSPAKISLLSQPAHILSRSGASLAHTMLGALRSWEEIAPEIVGYVAPQRRHVRRPDRVRVVEFNVGHMVCYQALDEDNLFVCRIEIGADRPEESTLRAAAALGAVERVLSTVTFDKDASYSEVLEVLSMNQYIPETSFVAGSHAGEASPASFVDRSGDGLGMMRWFADRALDPTGLDLGVARVSPAVDILPTL